VEESLLRVGGGGRLKCGRVHFNKVMQCMFWKILFLVTKLYSYNGRDHFFIIIGVLALTWKSPLFIMVLSIKMWKSPFFSLGLPHEMW